MKKYKERKIKNTDEILRNLNGRWTCDDYFIEFSAMIKSSDRAMFWTNVIPNPNHSVLDVLYKNRYQEPLHLSGTFEGLYSIDYLGQTLYLEFHNQKTIYFNIKMSERDDFYILELQENLQKVYSMTYKKIIPTVNQIDEKSNLDNIYIDDNDSVSRGLLIGTWNWRNNHDVEPHFFKFGDDNTFLSNFFPGQAFGTFAGKYDIVNRGGHDLSVQFANIL